MNTVNAYDKLYNNMKSRFTVVGDNAEYTLGEYMLMKAGKKTASSKLPVTKSEAANQTAVTAFFKYVNDKLTDNLLELGNQRESKFVAEGLCAH